MKAIIYTDGGARPSRGAGGWGIHGYIYTDEKPKQGSGCSWYVTSKGYVSKAVGDVEKPVEVEPLVKPAEVTVVKYIDGFGGFVEEVTNNNAELEAFDLTLRTLLKEEGLTEIHIWADSRYTIDGAFKWLNGWVLKNFVREDGTEVKNSAQWQRIYDLMQQCKERGIIVRGDWIMAHNGHLGNETADDYATQGVMYSQVGPAKVKEHEAAGAIKFSDPKGYWKESIDFNRLICGNRIVLIWNRNDAALSIADHHSYFMYESADKDPDGRPESMNGKASANTAIGITVLKTPDPVLDIILERQKGLDVAYPVGLAKVRTDIVTRPTIYNGILDSKGIFAGRSSATADLHYLYDKERPISIELRPLGLAYRLLDEYADLMGVLKEVIADPVSDRPSLFITEVTDTFYFDAGTKKPDIKLKPEIIQSLQNISLNVKYLDNTGETLEVKMKEQHLAMGLSIPKRNTLSAIADVGTKLYIVTWPFTDRMYRHAFVATTAEGAMIWSSVYSNYGLFR